MATAIVALVLLLVVGAIVYGMVKDKKKGKHTCGGDCGRCRGEKPPAILVRRCPSCGRMNAPGTRTCAACGGSLELQSGTTSLAPGKRIP